jgi:hypothetical protein
MISPLFLFVKTKIRRRENRHYYIKQNRNCYHKKLRSETAKTLKNSAERAETFKNGQDIQSLKSMKK